MRRPRLPTKIIDRLELQIVYRGPLEQWDPTDEWIHRRLDAFAGGLPPRGLFGDTILQYGCDWIVKEEDKNNEAVSAFLVETAKTAIRRGLYPVLRSVERYRKRITNESR